MAIATQNNILNIQSGSVPVTVHLSQGDVGNTVGFYIYNGSEPVIMDGYQISVHGIRQDGVGFGPYQVSKRTHSNYVYFNITNDMTAVRGAALAELTITNGSGASVGTANFAMLVERGTFPNGPVYDTDISVYQQILNYVQTIPASVRAEIADLQSQTHNIVADMKADTNLKTGMYVRTGGYYAVNDGGSALYRINSTIPTTHYETLTNGLYAELIVNESVTVEMFGAKGDGSTNDYTAFNAALNSGHPVYLLSKVYKVSTPLTISKPVIVNGTSPQRLKTNRPQIDFSAINGDAITLTVPGVVFNDISFFGNRTNTNLFSMSNIYRLTCNRCGFYEFNIALKTNRAWNTGWNNCVWEFCNKCCEFDGINTSHVFNGCNFYSSTYGIHSKQELDYSVCTGCGFDTVDTIAEFETSYANNMSFVNCGFESYITGIYCKGNSYAVVINPTLISDERSVETYKGFGQITVIGGRTDNVLTPNKKDVLYIGTVLNENANQINASFAFNERIFTPIGTGGIYDYIYPVSVGYEMKINFTAETVFDVQIDVCSTEYPETYHFTKESTTVAKTQGTPATFTYAITANDNVTITFTRGGNIRVRAWFKYGGSIT